MLEQDDAAELLVAFELHSVEGIRAVLDRGFDAAAPFRGMSPINHLLGMYTRSARFAECLRLLLDRGAVLDDPVTAPALLNDTVAIRLAVQADPTVLSHRTTMPSAFTPLDSATLLHVAAEFGNTDAARTLIDLGADVNAVAAIDEHGLNGHTPIFHTVNSIGNLAAPIMRLLLDADASASVRLAGIVWGRGYEWETTVFDVTPVSYAQFGLLPQFHRKEAETYENVRLLLAAAGRPAPPLSNVPNRYLRKG